MKHVVFFLYLLAYTTGIGTIVLSFNYLKYKPRYFKYLIFFDLYFTLQLIFDTLNLYFTQIVNYYPAGIIIFILAGSFGSAIGMAYSFGKYVCRFLNREPDNTVTLVLRSGVILTGSVLILLIILTLHRLFPAAIAVHTLFTIICVFLNGMMGYNLCLLFLNLDKNEQEKEHRFFLLITGIIMLPAPILIDLLVYRFALKFPSMSPIGYFIFNLWFIYYNRLLHGPPAEVTGLGGGNAKKMLLPSPELIREYNITGRELEVLQLILEGCNNNTIAKKLFISTNTVHNHIYNIFRKLGVKNRYELIRIFY
jgi:Response regulator containing a CheY-like receiver domain and an HTH DNA-binding domain